MRIDQVVKGKNKNDKTGINKNQNSSGLHMAKPIINKEVMNMAAIGV